MRRRALALAVAVVIGVGGTALVRTTLASAANSANCHSTKTCNTTTSTTVKPSTTTTGLVTTTTKASTTTTTATPVSTTSTTVGATTTTVTAAPGTCVALVPGANIQAALDAYGPGTTFCFASGTYVLSRYLLPRANDTLISTVPRGAILTGNDLYNGGITSVAWPNPYVTGVRVSGFKIQHFANQNVTWPKSAIQTGPGWTVDNNEIAYNTQHGVELASGNVLRGNWIHHNGGYGFSGGPLDNLLVENNEVSFNNPAHNYIGNAGGSKIHQSSHVVIRGNNVHDNYGNGIHTDWENIYVTVENNTVTNNYGVGIFHEGSADAVIRNNTLANNDLRIAGMSLYHGADLYLNDSKNTEIYGNVINAGVHGIGLYDNDRGSGVYGLLEIRNVYVHDNTVRLPLGGLTGLLGAGRLTAYTADAANRFVHNTYYVKDLAFPTWQWNTVRTWSEWRALGNDTTGSLIKW